MLSGATQTQLLKNPTEQKRKSLGVDCKCSFKYNHVEAIHRSVSGMRAWHAGLASFGTGSRPLTTSALAGYSLFQLLSLGNLVQIKTIEKLAYFWELTLIYFLTPLGLLASPIHGREQEPPPRTATEAKDNEEDGGKEQKCGAGTENRRQASLLHPAEIRASQKTMTKSAQTEKSFFILSKCFNIIKWLRGLSPLR